MHCADPARLARILTCICMAGTCGMRAQAAQGSDPGARDSISVSADSAFEDRGSRALQLQGNVRVSGSDWEFTAERATLSGTLDDAEQVDAQGAPARIFFRKAGNAAGIDEVEGVARDISYRRHEDVLHLRGGARLRRDANMLSSEDIEYRRAGDLFKAGGAGGVRLTITPGQRRSAGNPPPD
jgi:lipopolysaccharide transport protein LptA